MSDDKAKPKQVDLSGEGIPEGYDEVESANFKKFEDFGDSVGGQLLAKDRSEQYNFGLYSVMTEDGEQVRFHGSAQLDDLMLTIKIGDNIFVKYIDEQETPRGKLKLFKVYKGKGE